MIHWQLPVVLSEEQSKENNTLGFVMEKCISSRWRESSENKYRYMPRVWEADRYIFNKINAGLRILLYGRVTSRLSARHLTV